MFRAKEQLQVVIAVNQPHKPAQSVSPGHLHVFPRKREAKGQNCLFGQVSFFLLSNRPSQKGDFQRDSREPNIARNYSADVQLCLVRLVGEKTNSTLFGEMDEV
ncbi:hypothetical protein H0G86_005727 [Trichoderma simmonsii]|uniref:Uncharacterized protein n=1 Tax=Trichoderma simmonsii TaxID=1491479 RepID=A0A8G0LD48_9HYPO|nr:hypothetical protein H0G86_005727 [Trichoderma simmonsii]